MAAGAQALKVGKSWIGHGMAYTFFFFYLDPLLFLHFNHLSLIVFKNAFMNRSSATFVPLAKASIRAKFASSKMSFLALFCILD